LSFQVAIQKTSTPCSVVVGYQSFGAPCCLHLQSEHSAAYEFDAFTTVKIQVEIYWVVTPCNL